MPGLPLVARETTCSRSRTADQMCRQNSRIHLSPEETFAAEESLSVYCKPVELYNILQRRALHNPSFLQRCLHYKIQARLNHRIRLTLSLSAKMNDDVQSHSLFPMYILLASPITNLTGEEHSAVYHLSRVCILPTFSEFGRRDRPEANFVIPEVRKLLTDARSRNLSMILVSHGEGSLNESHGATDRKDVLTFPSKLEGNCVWGKLPLESLFSSPEKDESLSLGQRVEFHSIVGMHSSTLEPTFLDAGSCVTFQMPQNSGAMNTLYQVKLSISAQEVGARERSPYDSYTYDDVPTSSLSHIIRLRVGNVIFNYRYYNNTLQKTEVTEDFSCPFCLVRCASYKGLRYHLTSYHDLFNFEFWVTEEYQAVNVSVRADIWRSEIVADGVDPRLQTFCYWSRLNRRRRPKNVFQNVNHVHPHALKSDPTKVLRDISHEGLLGKDKGITDTELVNGLNGNPAAMGEVCSKALLNGCHYRYARYGSENPSVECTEQVSCSPGIIADCAASAQGPTVDECGQPVFGSNNLAPTAMLQFAKTRKLSVDRADPKNRILLQKRQFFHSHRAQPMALEQVLSDRDSEDEVDDDIADFEDRRMLDDFVDVTKDEKHIMHLWNSFVRKQRVLADGHIPWACEAFTKLNGRGFVRARALMWCWRLFMIKLWNHSLLDARTMNNCNILLEKYQNESSDPKQN
uniref:Polycomb group protein EMBRYONIC FLOWER 2 n=2 Tax=Anthurium amnicola TaxID=1678845 RepID=A0A1D1Y7L6_9ARAE